MSKIPKLDIQLFQYESQGLHNLTDRKNNSKRDQSSLYNTQTRNKKPVALQKDHSVGTYITTKSNISKQNQILQSHYGLRSKSRTPRRGQPDMSFAEVSDKTRSPSPFRSPKPTLQQESEVNPFKNAQEFLEAKQHKKCVSISNIKDLQNFRQKLQSIDLKAQSPIKIKINLAKNVAPTSFAENVGGPKININKQQEQLVYSEKEKPKKQKIIHEEQMSIGSIVNQDKKQAEQSQKMHHLKILQKKNHQNNGKIIQDIEQSKNIQKNLDAVPSKLDTINQLTDELRKIQSNLQNKMADKIQENFKAEMKTIRSTMKGDKKQSRMSSVDGTSANIISSSFGTNVSKSLFDGMSNFSNVDEHDLVEQSKLADQKIQFLQKQIQLIEERKKLEQLKENDNSMIYNLGLLEQKFSKQNETLADNSNDSLAILAKQFEKEQADQNLKEMGISLRTLQKPGVIGQDLRMRAQRDSSKTTTRYENQNDSKELARNLKRIDEKIEMQTKSSDKNDVDQSYLLQARILIDLLNQSAQTKIYANQIQVYYDDFSNYIQQKRYINQQTKTNIKPTPSLSLSRVIEGYQKLQIYIQKLQQANILNMQYQTLTEQIDLQIHLIISIIQAIQKQMNIVNKSMISKQQKSGSFLMYAGIGSPAAGANTKQREMRSLFNKRTDNNISHVKILSKPIKMFNEPEDIDTPKIEDLSSERAVQPKSASRPLMSKKSLQYSGSHNNSAFNISSNLTMLASPKQTQKIRQENSLLSPLISERAQISDRAKSRLQNAESRLNNRLQQEQEKSSQISKSFQSTNKPSDRAKSQMDNSQQAQKRSNLFASKSNRSVSKSQGRSRSRVNDAASNISGSQYGEQIPMNTFQMICDKVIKDHHSNDPYAKLVSLNSMYQKACRMNLAQDKLQQFIKNEFVLQIKGYRVQFNDLETPTPTPIPVAETNFPQVQVITSQNSIVDAAEMSKQMTLGKPQKKGKLNLFSRDKSIDHNESASRKSRRKLLPQQPNINNVLDHVSKAPPTRNEAIADSGSTKNLSYTRASKPKKFDGEGTIQLDVDSQARETGGTPRFKSKIRLSKDPMIEDVLNLLSSDEEKQKPKKKKKSPAPLHRKPEGVIQQKQQKLMQKKQFME